MNILIIGCGDVGATLADELSAQGHDISVVDSRPERFANLSGGFRGMITQGFECDMGVLGKAGIDSCDVVIAVAEDDNINIMAAQIVKGKYKGKRVITRIFDPERESAFSDKNLNTVCPTKLTIEALRASVTEPDRLHQTVHFGPNSVVFTVMNAEPDDAGKTLRELAQEYAAQNELLFGVLHSGGELSLAVEYGERVLCESDRLIVSRRVD